MAHSSPRARGEGKEGGDGDSQTGLARWSGGAPVRSPEPRTGPMAVAAVDRDLEQRESERARMRIRVRDWGGREGMRDWGCSRAGLLASWLLRCAYIDQGQGRPAGPAFVGCSLLGQMGHRAITVPACTTVPCLGRATGQGGGLDMAWSIGPCRQGPTSHRAVPCPCRAKRPGHGPCRRASGCMAFYIGGLRLHRCCRHPTF